MVEDHRTNSRIIGNLWLARRAEFRAVGYPAQSDAPGGGDQPVLHSVEEGLQLVRDSANASRISAVGHEGRARASAVGQVAGGGRDSAESGDHPAHVHDRCRSADRRGAVKPAIVGYAAAGLGEISERAGMTKRARYHHSTPKKR